MSAENHANSLLKKLEGSRIGTCRTWLDASKPPDEASVESTIESLPNIPMLRHRYESEFQGKHRSGEETIVFNSVTGLFEVMWIDSFHMNYGMMHSKGTGVDDGFTVAGAYDVGEGHPKWGWKTTYELKPDELVITAWNVHPDGKEDLAIETRLTSRPN